MLSFKQRVAFLRFKRRVVVWVNSHRLFVGCLTAALLLLATRYALGSRGQEHNAGIQNSQNGKPIDQPTDPRRKPVVNQPDVPEKKAENLPQKDEKADDTRKKPIANQPDPDVPEKKTENLAQKDEKADEDAQRDSRAKQNVLAPVKQENFIEPSDPRFLTGLMCVIQSAVRHAGDDIRELKQRNLLNDVATASLRAIARRLRGKWPTIPLSTVSDHSIDDVIKSEKLADDSDCKIENLNVGMDGLEIIINPVDSQNELAHDLLDHVTTSACVLYRHKPVAGLIYQPFLKRAVSSIINHHNDPENRVLQDEAKQRISISQTEFSQARSFIGDSVLPNPRLGGVDYGILSVILDPSKQENVASDAMTYLRLERIPGRLTCAGDAIITGYKGRFTSFRAAKPKYDEMSKDVKMEGLWVTMSSTQTDGKIGVGYAKVRGLIK